MPVAGEPTFAACENKMKSKEGYSSEVAKKVCGKIEAESKATVKQEYLHSIPSPILDNLKEVTPADKGVQKAMHEWEFDPASILASKRKVTGTFHVPKVDKDQELITKEAMDKAIPNFMHLPIMHDFHKERVLGVITKVWVQDSVYHYDAVIKSTHDVDDAWAKMQKGEYDHVSIYGSRLKGNGNCQLDPALRTSPCVSEEIRLDSISACDTNARNDGTELKLAKSGNVIWDGTDVIRKAMTMGAEGSGSSLMHVVADSKRFNKGRIKKMRVREADENERDYQENDMEKGFAHYGRGAGKGSGAARAIHNGRSQLRSELEDLNPKRESTAMEGMRNLHKGDVEENPQAPRPLNANQTRSEDNDNVEEKASGESRTQRVSRTERNRGDKKHDINLSYGKPEREMKKSDEDEYDANTSARRVGHGGKTDYERDKEADVEKASWRGYDEEEHNSSHTHEERETKKDKREEKKADVDWGKKNQSDRSKYLRSESNKRAMKEYEEEHEEKKSYRGYDEEADGDNTMHKGGEQDEMEKGKTAWGGTIGTHTERSSRSHNKSTGENFDSTDPDYKMGGRPSRGLHKADDEEKMEKSWSDRAPFKQAGESVTAHSHAKEMLRRGSRENVAASASQVARFRREDKEERHGTTGSKWENNEAGEGMRNLHKADEVEKASKDGVLSKIYSMLRKLMKDDEEMVEKDEETHKKMEKAEKIPHITEEDEERYRKKTGREPEEAYEKAESKQAGVWGADGETRKAKGEPFKEHKKEDRPDKDPYGEEDDEPEDNEDKDEEYPEKEDKPRKDKPKAASKEKAKRFQKGWAHERVRPNTERTSVSANKKGTMATPNNPETGRLGWKHTESKVEKAEESRSSAGQSSQSFKDRSEAKEKGQKTPEGWDSVEKSGNERKCPCKPATHSEVQKGKGDSLKGEHTKKEIPKTEGRFKEKGVDGAYKINNMKSQTVNPAPETMNINSYSQGALTVGEDAYKIKHEHTPSAGLPAEIYKIKKGEVSMETEDIIQKAKLDGEMTDEAFVVEIVKAAVPTDEIMKALTDLKEQNESLKAEIAAIKEQPIQKAVVQIVEDPTKEAPLNYAAEAEFFKKRA